MGSKLQEDLRNLVKLCKNERFEKNPDCALADQIYRATLCPHHFPFDYERSVYN